VLLKNLFERCYFCQLKLPQHIHFTKLLEVKREFNSEHKNREGGSYMSFSLLLLLIEVVGLKWK